MVDSGVPDFLLCWFPRRRDAAALDFLVAAGLRCPIRWWGGAPARPLSGFLLAGRVGPAELPREAAKSPLGVPGPRED